jgi:DNA topoisomerase I
MAKALIIVESPAKIKTLRKFLGPQYVFESSLGHVRDLPQRGFGIDTENDFEPQYETLPEKEKVIQKLVQAAKGVDEVYLCPDPDREGEAIAWHIAQILPKGTKIKRAAFHSITKDEVQRALNEPMEINYAMVDAQQARRLLDRIVGYKISPILARRVQGGRRAGGSLSAGRVQSVALKLVVDREKEIEAFNPVEYWTLTAEMAKKEDGATFPAILREVDGKRIEKELVEGKVVQLVGDEQTARHLQQRMESGNYSVTRVERKEKRRNPVAPFITSTMQQEASRHHGFNASRTMSVAQGLYEGIDLGSDGPEGLITYMRTDSVRSAPEAVAAVRAFIEGTYGKENLSSRPRVFSSKKSAQDAHECVRPTNFDHPPEKVKPFLTRDQFLLYSLIWKRFLASQMAPAVYDTVSADVTSDNGLLLRSTGSILKFRGFLTIYHERKDEGETEDSDTFLPPLEEGMATDLKKLDVEQSFTRPPPRYSEASLVRELEKCGIGRPSTYATIMTKIQSRDYTVREKGRLIPTELGRICAEMLEAHFPQVMDINFTAHMEDDLEAIAADRKEWKTVIREFWSPFIETVKEAEKSAFVPRVETDLPCPKCGKHLQKIWARGKYFYGCLGYPDCDYSAPIQEVAFDRSEYDPDFDWEQACPECGKEMKVRHGRYGAFLGCTDYPDCKGTVNIPKKGEDIPSADQMPACPAIGCPGKISARRSRYGKIFFSCSTYPDCDVIVNKLEDLPVKYADHPRTPYEKKTRKKGAKTTKTKKKAAPKKPRKTTPRELSPELAAIVGASEMTRGDVMKQLWAYIKKNNCQDPNNGRIIMPDAKLAALFGSSEPIDMFKLAGLISKHLK